MTQTTLDDALAKAAAIHTARASDPDTSHAAARLSSVSERRRSQLRLVLEAVRVAPGMTSAEYGAFLGMDRYAVARRLPELRLAGLVDNGPDITHPRTKICSRTGHSALIWNPTEKGKLP
jgi:CRP-like cAMP-binding protein